MADRLVLVVRPRGDCVRVTNPRSIEQFKRQSVYVFSVIHNAFFDDGTPVAVDGGAVALAWIEDAATTGPRGLPDA